MRLTPLNLTSITLDWIASCHNLHNFIVNIRNGGLPELFYSKTMINTSTLYVTGLTCGVEYTVMVSIIFSDGGMRVITVNMTLDGKSLKIV